MTLDEYDKGLQANYAALDKIDFEGYLTNRTDNRLDFIMDDIEHDYDYTELTDTEELEGYIFNWINEEEFADYLKKRYGDRFNFRKTVITYNTFTFK